MFDKMMQVQNLNMKIGDYNHNHQDVSEDGSVAYNR